MTSDARPVPKSASDWRPVLFAAHACRPSQSPSEVGEKLDDVDGAVDVADRLTEVVGRLDGIPGWLLGNGQLTASVYVDAASRSLVLANEIIRLTERAPGEEEPGESEIDPRLLEWLI